MWKMDFPDGKLMRDGFANQWEALRAACTADGSR